MPGPVEAPLDLDEDDLPLIYLQRPKRAKRSRRPLAEKGEAKISPAALEASSLRKMAIASSGERNLSVDDGERHQLRKVPDANSGERNFSALSVSALQARLLKFCPESAATMRRDSKADLTRKLAAYHEEHPRQVTLCSAPFLPDQDYEHLIKLLGRIGWHRYSVKSKSQKYGQTKKELPNKVVKNPGGAVRAVHGKGVRAVAVGSQNFVLGASLGPLGSGGFEQKGPKKGLGKNTTIVKCRQKRDAKTCLKLWKSMRRLIKAIDPDYMFTSIQVNRNFLGKPHCDSKDRSYQYALSLGDFSGGKLMIETDDPERLTMLDTRGRLTKCDGRRPHWVTPYEGTRYSLIMYRCLGRQTPLLSNCGPDTNAQPV